MFSTPSMSFFIFLLLYLVFALLYLTLGRPYLRKKKGKLSVDDEIPYAIIPMMALLFLVFLTDIIRYHFGTDVSLGEVGTMFKMTFDMTASAVYLGFILPHVFQLKYASGARFMKPIAGTRAVFLIMLALASILVWARGLAEAFFGGMDEAEILLKLTFVITLVVVYLGIMLPYVFHFKYAEVRFTKPLTGNRAMFFLIVPLASVYFWSGKLDEVIFLLLI